MDIIFYINSFSSPVNIESLVIQNCTKVNVLVRCTGEIRKFKTITVMNIKHLVLERTNYVSTVSPHFVLKNIEYIETIPSFTFSQRIRTLLSPGCSLQSEDFGNFTMINVNIDTIESNAFYMPNGFGHFRLSNVTIKRIQNSAIQMKLNKNGDFLLENSKVDILEHLAVQVVGKNVTIRNNKFNEISAGGFNGTIEEFSFIDNVVNTLQSHGISILSKTVRIQRNKIEYLKSSALEKISPGLLEDSGRNFGTLRFYYLFEENYVINFDAGSLQPDVDAYNNVASEVEVVRNQFTCNCDNIAWLISELGHGSNTALMTDLYEAILSNETKNECAHSCQLPLNSIRRMVSNGKCNPDITTSYLCDEKEKTTTISANTKKTKISNSPTAKPASKKYHPIIPFFSSGATNQNCFVLLALFVGLTRVY